MASSTRLPIRVISASVGARFVGTCVKILMNRIATLLVGCCCLYMYVERYRAKSTSSSSFFCADARVASRTSGALRSSGHRKAWCDPLDLSSEISGYRARRVPGVRARSPPVIAQWPAYPTKNAPRGADGKPDLNAAAPRTAEGKPDLSGVWNYAGVLGFRGGPPPRLPAHRCKRRSGTSRPGSRKGCRSRPGARSSARADGQRQQGQPRRRVPAARADAAAHSLAAAQDHSNQGFDRHPLRGQRQRAADLSRRAIRSERRSAALVVRLLARLVGRRHAGRRDDELPRRNLARRQRRAALARRASSPNAFVVPRSAHSRST